MPCLNWGRNLPSVTAAHTYQEQQNISFEGVWCSVEYTRSEPVQQKLIKFTKYIDSH